MFAYRRHPLFTSATYARPIVVANLGTAFLVGADDLAGELAVRERRFHPFHLKMHRNVRQFSPEFGGEELKEGDHTGSTK